MPGLLEILIIVIAALVLFGYKRIPFIGKSLGIGVSEFGKSFRKAANIPVAFDEPEKEDAKV